MFFFLNFNRKILVYSSTSVWDAIEAFFLSDVAKAVDAPWETRHLPASSLWVSCRDLNSLFIIYSLMEVTFSERREVSFAFVSLEILMAQEPWSFVSKFNCPFQPLRMLSLQFHNVKSHVFSSFCIMMHSRTLETEWCISSVLWNRVKSKTSTKSLWILSVHAHDTISRRLGKSFISEPDFKLLCFCGEQWQQW